MSTALVSTIQTDSLDRYMSVVNRHPVLSRDEEVTLARQYFQTGDIRAAHQLVISNLRFVVKIAHEYRGYGFKILDLVQEGNIGLMVAVKKFNPDKGYRLISYAVWWIRAYIQNYVMRSWSVVRMGASRIQRRLFFKLRSARRLAEKEAGPGAVVSTKDLAERLQVDESEVLETELRMAAHDFSLDAKIGDESGSATYLDMVQEPEANQEEAYVRAEEQEILRGKVQKAMTGLNEKERYIVENRLLTEEPQTLQEIGEKFKVSRERIRQLETRVISKLRSSFAPHANA